jgi:hypothetical protein
MTIGQFEKQFPDEDACKGYLMENRWPDNVNCPRCGNDKVWELESRPFHWQCKMCAADGYRFSVLVGTIFENSNKPLREWFMIVGMMRTIKKLISTM